MLKKILAVIALTLSIMIVTFVGKGMIDRYKQPIVPSYDLNVEPMPIVTDDPFAHLAYGGAPIEQRDERFRKWLAVSLKISVSNASGSGTIVFYDSKDRYAYVQSCGHLWDGNMTAEEGKRRKVMCKVITWYKNDKKLEKTESYPAEVIYYSNKRGTDVSLLRFKPDWEPAYVPIAPIEFRFNQDMRLHSCGCDGGRECAHYDVRYIGSRGEDIVTTENSPRPGRSGGGLMTDNYYAGICWGTTDISGSGNGLFTPLSVLREFNEKNGYGWLNDVGINWARQIPIIDRNNPQQQYPPNYVPLPDGR